jgi:predicted ATPase
MAVAASRTAGHGTAAEHNVSAPLTSLIGRSSELHGVGETLRRTRLVTLTGPGGAGKTRVAIELAGGEIGRRADGVWLVDLTAGPADPDPAAELARILGVGARSAVEPTESLRRYLADRDMLLVLDNCEHLIDACAELASSLLRSCGNLRILGDEPRIARRERRNGMAVGRTGARGRAAAVRGAGADA